jgi:hypothetical protein
MTAGGNRKREPNTDWLQPNPAKTETDFEAVIEKSPHPLVARHPGRNLIRDRPALLHQCILI